MAGGGSWNNHNGICGSWLSHYSFLEGRGRNRDTWAARPAHTSTDLDLFTHLNNVNQGPFQMRESWCLKYSIPLGNTLKVPRCWAIMAVHVLIPSALTPPARVQVIFWATHSVNCICFITSHGSDGS